MIFKRDFFVGANDIDFELNMKDKAILKYLEEIAGLHSDLAGYGLNDIEKTKITWLVLGWKVEVIRRPKYAEEFTINTWCKTQNKLYSKRDFEVFDSKGNLIIKATSKWLMINTETREIGKIPLEFAIAYGDEDIDVFENTPNFKFKEPNDKEKVLEYTITEGWIDFNNHVHNTKYIDLAIKALPKELREQNFSNFEIMYKKEIKLGEKINLYYTVEDNVNIVVIKSEDEKVLHSIIKFYN